MVRKATGMVNDIELGNLMFGHSRGIYHVEPREDYQDAFCDFLFANDGDCYGYFAKADEYGCYENDTFIVRPYYWGEDETIAELPNFVYKPTGLEIRWYKYPMRDAYSNQDVDVDTFRAILAECTKSMEEETRV